MKRKGFKERLTELGAETLADALTELAVRSQDAADLVERLVATPKENIKRYKAKIAGLKRSRSFVPYGQSFEFSRKLKDLLADLQAGVNDPKTGVELVAEFFKCDKTVFERCDDSSGSIGDVFRMDARDLFAHYAAECADKSWLCDLLVTLHEDDDYGVRAVLIDSASKFLSDEHIRELAARCWGLADQEKQHSSEAKHWFFAIKSLARQMGDVALFEKVSLALWPELYAVTCMEIAQVYLETGDAQSALSWMEKSPPADQFRENERDQLLLGIYETLGDRQNMADTAWLIFLRQRSGSNLEMLLEIIGESERERVIDEQSRRILHGKLFSSSDAVFLIEAGRLDDAEKHILQHAEQLDGDSYTGLLPLAQNMEKAEYWLAAYVIYRALLESILKRALSKYYHHGVRYLKKLDKLSPKITDWREVMHHDTYKQELTKTHFRKKAFWSKYAK